mmetsp:Transcript_41634/g.129771  ORF Transcript_41634/g.129771 Transcript_41634/m.129771 type:complete len:227 (-) Transcript_41634:1451-2131(-)
MLGTATAQNRLTESAARGNKRRVVVQAGLLEGGEGIRRKHLGPLVRVVASGVPSREDVRKGAEETILWERRQHGVLRGDAALHVEGALTGGFRVVPGVQLHVQRAQLELPKHERSGHEHAGPLDLVKDVAWQGLASLVVDCKGVNGRLVVQPVLHELRGQLHGVPLHVVDTRGVAVLHAREHVLESVAELMEQRLRLGEGHEGGFVPHRRRAVAGEVGHGLGAQGL